MNSFILKGNICYSPSKTKLKTLSGYVVCKDGKCAGVFEEAFYMATKGGGEFFGKVGSFEEGYEFDALVLDDRILAHPSELNLRQRIERSIYLSLDMCGGIKEKYVQANKII